MNYIKVCYKNHSKLFNLTLLGISVSITLGLIISLCLDKSLVDDIYNLFLNHLNSYNSNIISNILYPIINYLLIFLFSLMIIGVFVPFLSIFIENMSIGLILGVLIKKSTLKGLLFGIIYFGVTKLIYLIILLYLTFNIYKFVSNVINSLRNKNNNSIYNLYSNILIKLLFCIIAITIINLLNIFIAPWIFEIFIFLL